MQNVPEVVRNEGGLLRAETEQGICRVICFSPRHDITLAEMDLPTVETVIRTWQNEYKTLGALDYIDYVQIFENKGAIMGCSNPHPHGQIWAQHTVPVEPAKEQFQQLLHFQNNSSSLLLDYLQVELKEKERIVFENAGFVVLVPYWACWPFETMILPRRPIQNIVQLSETEVKEFAGAIQAIAIRYDNLFKMSFPYSAGIHQSPTDGLAHTEWQMHMHFYPPLLRSATIKKFMVGYELLANPQRDITPESSASILRSLPERHYSFESTN
jgi:UDPglucose--hexose-1-phosphate uridylyltransferase